MAPCTTISCGRNCLRQRSLPLIAEKCCKLRPLPFIPVGVRRKTRRVSAKLLPDPFDAAAKRDNTPRRHIRALLENVRQGAFFACVSEPVQKDLMRLAPRAESRLAVIPNMVSPLFSPDPPAPALLVEILRIRSCPPAAFAMGEDKKRRDPSPVHNDEPVPGKLFRAVLRSLVDS
jgi:hypothetical protein